MNQTNLRFMVDGVVYQFRVLPFGLNQAPRIFTFILRPVVALLREHGQRLHAYLDDWMLRACWESRMPYITRVSILLLQDLGWLINWEKTNFFLHRFWSSSDASETWLIFGRIFRAVRPEQTHSAKNIASLLGKCQSMSEYVHRGQLHLRNLQLWFRARRSQARGRWSD